MKYAVKIMLSADDWIYVTEDNGGNCWDLTPVLFDDIQEAERFAEIWRKKYKDNRYVKVVEYERELG
jgi:hypothetical protein